MLQIIRLAALLAVLSYAAAVKRCDSTKFRYCTVTMEKFLSIADSDIPTIWNNPSTFADKLEQLFIRKRGDMMSVAKICNGLQMFYSCLGPNGVQDCLDVNGFVTIGADPPSAYAFMGILNRWRFQCGAAFYGMQYTGTLECIQQTLRSYSAKLVTATEAYMTNVLHDPLQACKYASALTKTSGSLFATSSCITKNSDFARWFGCEGANEFTLAQFRHCETVNKCNFGSPANAKDAEYVKIVDGELKVKIQPTWMQDQLGIWHLAPEKWI